MRLKAPTGEAEPLLRECLSICAKLRPAGHWQIASTRSLLGGCLLEQKQLAAAEPLLLAAAETLAVPTGAPHKTTGQALQRVITLYEMLDQPERAEVWRHKRSAVLR